MQPKIAKQQETIKEGGFLFENFQIQSYDRTSSVCSTDIGVLQLVTDCIQSYPCPYLQPIVPMDPDQQFELSILMGIHCSEAISESMT